MHFFKSEFAWGLGYLGGPDPEVCYFYSQIGLEETFEVTLQNRKPQMPSSVEKQPVLQLVVTSCVPSDAVTHIRGYKRQTTKWASCLGLPFKPAASWGKT